MSCPPINVRSHRRTMLKVIFLIATVVAFSAAIRSTQTLFAQSDTQATPQTDPQSNTTSPVDTSAISADQVNLIARELWCPLCSGVRLDSCELKACQQMREVIAIKLAEGEDLAAIRTYFVAQYGPQVLGEPPLTGFNWLAWLLPFIVLAIGGYVLWRTVGRMTQPLPATLAAQMNAKPTSAAEKTEVDEYEEKLAEELKAYE